MSKRSVTFPHSLSRDYVKRICSVCLVWGEVRCAPMGKWIKDFESISQQGKLRAVRVGWMNEAISDHMTSRNCWNITGKVLSEFQWV